MDEVGPLKCASVGLSGISSACAPSLRNESGHNSPFITLYERGKRQQWNASTDLNWKLNSSASRIPEESTFSLASFDKSPLARYGHRLWDAFKSEFQAWMVSQFLPGEQAAMIAAARLLETVPDADARLCLAAQVADEARHIETFTRYICEKVPDPYPPSQALALLLDNVLKDRCWDIMVLGMHILVESLALASFRLADRTFSDDLLRRICGYVARDESRHVSLGILSLRNLYPDMTQAELNIREQLVLESIDLVRQRFMLSEVWDRLGVRRDQALSFMETNDLMIQYRQTVCAKLVTSLVHIHLNTNRIRKELVHSGLLGPRYSQGLIVGV